MPRIKIVRGRSNLGPLLLGAWLILFGLARAVGLSFYFMDSILGALAIGAGVCLLLDR